MVLEKKALENPEIDWGLDIASAKPVAGQCTSIAPWPDENDGVVRCCVESNHVGLHGGNGWTWA